MTNSRPAATLMAALALSAPYAAAADAYPAKPLRFVVAFPPGGGTDFASSGPGTPAHLGGELFNSMAGVKMVHVPYKGAAPALADLLGGQVQLMFSTMPPALPHVKDGKLRALAVTSAKRSPAAPELPTVDEIALPGFEANTWHGVVAPAGTPAAIVARLNREIVAILHLPEVVERPSV